MTLWDIFKKKKPSLKKERTKKAKSKKPEAKKLKAKEVKGGKPKTEKPKPKKKKKTEKEPALISKKKKKIEKGLAFRVLKSPHITEKATDLAEKNQYVFEVYSSANKTEIKRALEQLYNVDVLSVRTMKVPRKRRRVRRVLGWRKGYKKAIVRIKEGQKIGETFY